MDLSNLLAQTDPPVNWHLLLQGGAFAAVATAVAAVLGTLIKRSQALGTTNIGDLARFRAELIARADRAEVATDDADRRLIAALRMVALLSGDLVILIGFVENTAECLKRVPPDSKNAERIVDLMFAKLSGINARVERDMRAITEETAQAKADSPRPEPQKVNVELSQRKDD